MHAHHNLELQSWLAFTAQKSQRENDFLVGVVDDFWVHKVTMQHMLTSLKNYHHD